MCKRHIDSIRISDISDGLVHFEVDSGGKKRLFCMSVGKYRRFLAIAEQRVDEWIGAQGSPVRVGKGH